MGNYSNAEISAFMSEMGRKGGLVGGKRRLETMTPAARSAAASKAARARWGKYAQSRASSTTRQRHAEWSISTWPIGTKFEIYFKQGDVMTNCVLTRYTAKRVYWFKPEYDGAMREARRQSLDNFKAEVASGIIRKLR